MDNQTDQKQTPISPTVAPTPANSSRSFLSKYMTLIVITFVAALLASTGTYLALKQSTKPPSLSQNAISSPTTDLTADWINYDWKQMAFKYPPNWTVKKIFYLTPSQNAKGDSPENIGLQLFRGKEITGNDFIQIGGRQISCDPPQTHTKCYYIPFVSEYVYTNSNNPKLMSTFDLLIKTIKNKTVADWKTYRNEELGFELRYPPDWSVDLKEAPNAFIITNGQSNIKIDPDGNGRGLYLTPKQNFNTTISGKNAKRTDFLTEDNKIFFSFIRITEHTENGWDPNRSYILLDSSKGMEFEMIDHSTQVARGTVQDFGTLDQILSTFKFTDETSAVGMGCVLGGCSSQICIEEGQDVVTTCEYRTEYACYKTAKCEKQTNGKCGWTLTDELKTCLQNSK